MLEIIAEGYSKYNFQIKGNKYYKFNPKSPPLRANFPQTEKNSHLNLVLQKKI